MSERVTSKPPYEIIPLLVERKSELSKVRAENKRLRRRVKQLEASREFWRARARAFGAVRCRRRHIGDPA